MAEDNLNETASVDTLKPGAGSNGPGNSITSTMGAVLKAIRNSGQGGVDSEKDLSKLYDALDQIGHEADKVSGTAEGNRKTITAKGVASSAMKEDLDVLFNDEELELSEEFKTKAKTLFEAAVDLRVGLEVERIEEEAAEVIAETVQEYEEQLSEQVDQYVSRAATQFMEDNDLQIETSLRSRHLEALFEGLSDLLREHHVEIPEDQIDAVAEMTEYVEDLEEEHDATLNALMQAESVIEQYERTEVLAEAVDGLTDLDAERLIQLAENIEGSPEEFGAKLEVIKESYTGKDKSGIPAGLINENVDAVDVEEVIEESDERGGAPKNIGEQYAAAFSSKPRS